MIRAEFAGIFRVAWLAVCMGCAGELTYRFDLVASRATQLVDGLSEGLSLLPRRIAAAFV